MRIVVTGATGTVGRRVVARAHERGDAVVVLTRSPDRARDALHTETQHWDPLAAPAPAAALSGADAVIHLAGEPVSQRWTDAARRRIRESREIGTRNLVAGLGAVAADERPRALVSASASGFYGDRGDDLLTEDAGPGDGFLSQVCRAWEHEAELAVRHHVRVVTIRTGHVLSASGGMLEPMLRPFRMGVGGPIAGGRQYVPFIHVDDLADLYLRAAGDEQWSGPFNASAPIAITNRQFSRALGQVLRRPALVPVPGFAVRALFGDMAEIITDSQRMVPARALSNDVRFTYPEIHAALSSLLR